MSDCTSRWFGGLTVDHLFADCPNRQRGMAELARWGLADLGGPAIDPHGTDVCGMCRHRHDRAEHRRAAEAVPARVEPNEVATATELETA